MDKHGVTCDTCREYNSMPYTSFGEKRRKLDADGWWTRKMAGKFRHFCNATCINNFVDLPKRKPRKPFDPSKVTHLPYRD